MVRRAAHRGTPSTISKLNGVPRQSSHRQGNCMNCSLGRVFHSTVVIENISSAHAAAQATSEYQSAGVRLRQPRAAQAATTVSRISAIATQETKLLKALWSGSAMRVNRKLSAGRTPAETAS